MSTGEWGGWAGAGGAGSPGLNRHPPRHDEGPRCRQRGSGGGACGPSGGPAGEGRKGHLRGGPDARLLAAEEPPQRGLLDQGASPGGWTVLRSACPGRAASSLQAGALGETPASGPAPPGAVPAVRPSPVGRLPTCPCSAFTHPLTHSFNNHLFPRPVRGALHPVSSTQKAHLSPPGRALASRGPAPSACGAGTLLPEACALLTLVVTWEAGPPSRAPGLTIRPRPQEPTRKNTLDLRALSPSS